MISSPKACSFKTSEFVLKTSKKISKRIKRVLGALHPISFPLRVSRHYHSRSFGTLGFRASRPGMLVRTDSTSALLTLTVLRS